MRFLCVFCFQVIRSRLLKSKAAGHVTWNNQPGALVLSPNFSQDLYNLPFYNIQLGLQTNKFTAVIHATRCTVKESSSLVRLIRSVSQSKHVCKVIDPIHKGVSLFLSYTNIIQLIVCITWKNIPKLATSCNLRVIAVKVSKLELLKIYAGDLYEEEASIPISLICMIDS